MNLLSVPLSALWLTFAFSLAPIRSMADDLTYLDDLSFVGNGCDHGSAHATLAPDGQTLSVAFDDFEAEAGGTTRRTVQNQACRIEIPVALAPGWSFAVAHADYRGFLSLPSGGRAAFRAHHRWRNQRVLASQGVYKRYAGPYDGDFGSVDEPAIGHDPAALVWSPCGGKTSLFVYARLSVATNRHREQSYAKFDSVDLKQKATFRLTARRCK
jgi:hypothetical protein